MNPTEDQKSKRKTYTSTEVKQRYNLKTYNSYAVRLRKVEDADIIESVEKLKNAGVNTSDAFKQLIRNH